MLLTWTPLILLVSRTLAGSLKVSQPMVVKTQSGDKYLYNPSIGMESQSASLSESNLDRDKKGAEFRAAGFWPSPAVPHCDEGFGEWGEWTACERIGRDQCKSVRTREHQEDGSERYQLDVNPCNCQDAGGSEEELDEFPDDVIRAEWKEHTDSNEAESEEDSVEYKAESESQEEDSASVEYNEGKESEEDTDTTTFQEEDVSDIFENDENEDRRVTREKYQESSDEFYESNDDLSGAEQSDEEGFDNENEEISYSRKSRNRRKKHSRISRTQTINGIEIRQETSHEESSDGGKESQEDESKSLEEETKDVINEESNESFESSEEKSTSKFEEDVTGKTDEDEPVLPTTEAEGDGEQTTGPSLSNGNEEDTTKIKSSEEEEETTEHVERVTEMAVMPSEEVDDLFNDPSRESQSSEDTPSSSVQQSAPNSKDGTNIGSFEDPITFDRKRQRQGGIPVAHDRKFDREWKGQGQGLGNNLIAPIGRRGNSLS